MHLTAAVCHLGGWHVGLDSLGVCLGSQLPLGMWTLSRGSLEASPPCMGGWSSLPFASFLSTGSLRRRQDSHGHNPLVDCLPSWCLKADKWLTPWNSRLDPSYSHEFSLGSHRFKLFFQHFTQPGVPAGLCTGNSPRGELGAQGAWEVKGGGTRAVGEAGDWAAPR